MSNLRNRVQLVGHLGAAPELKNLDNGTQMVRLRLATNERYRTATGDWREETTWHNVSVWEKLVERASQLRKGSYLMLEGKLVNRSYNDAAGNKKFYTEIKAKNMLLLDKKSAEQGDQTTPDMPEESEEEGLPF